VSEQANPNAEGPDRLAGDMGLSSERTDFEGVEGTGTVGSAKGATDGSQPTEPPGDPEEPVRPHPQDPAEGADDEEEVNPAEVPAHENDPAKNPGHSHG
jgi:hypothetical protein